MKVYLDSCCYNRPFDGTTQERVNVEADAILRILRKGEIGEIEIIGSEIILLELWNMSDLVKKQNVLGLYRVTHSQVVLTDEIFSRSRQIMSESNIRRKDSLQIASAEAAGADVMLTTDDKLERMASRMNLGVRVMNPVKLLDEILYGGN
ncbi:MAG: PIN domain-containing protein [Oscillospiraceae bacterium]|nr:PIN domain-containing protein [Oscillospiraceae bacterium]